MTTKTIRVCDGCDAERLVMEGRTDDWKEVAVTVSGLDGYPTFRPDREEEYFDLCPSCARRFMDGISPKSWPRASVQAAEPIPS